MLTSKLNNIAVRENHFYLQNNARKSAWRPRLSNSDLKMIKIIGKDFEKKLKKKKRKKSLNDKK